MDTNTVDLVDSVDNCTDETILCTPPELKEIAKDVEYSLLPQKSKLIYTAAYNKFTKWRKSKNAPITENVILAYLQTLTKTHKPPSVWSIHSFLKATIKINDQIDIGKFTKVFSFLKRNAEGYKPKKAKILQDHEIETFLNTANDEQFLATKVSLIFGILGGLRIDELVHITVNDVEQHGEMLLIQIPKTKTCKPKSFTISGSYYQLVKKYMDLRPKPCETSRFFVNYRGGKCTVQNIGKNKFASMPKQIATFLQLETPELYTGHTFRRTSGSLLANAGADLTTIKRHGAWTSDKVAESYIENSITYKKKTENLIASSITLDVPVISSDQYVEVTQSASSKFKPTQPTSTFKPKVPILCSYPKKKMAPQFTEEDFLAIATNNPSSQTCNSTLTTSISQYMIEDYVDTITPPTDDLTVTSSEIRSASSTRPTVLQTPTPVPFSFNNCQNITINISK